MRIGINGSTHIALGSSTATIVEHARQAEADGFHTYWLAQIAVPDALTVLGVVGEATSRIELGTAVVATWTRHPLMLASQAITVSEIAGTGPEGESRVLLGIGLAHKHSIESGLKIPFEQPAKNMDEYLSVLIPAIRDRKVTFEGSYWSAEVPNLGGPGGVAPPSVMLAAMGPMMLKLAGSRTDGTILWLAGPKGIETVFGPTIRAAAEEAARPDPRIVASVPVCVTGNVESVRAMITSMLGRYGTIPSYRGVMDIEGAAGPEDVSIVGDEEAVRSRIADFEAAGTTDFSALEFTTNDDEVARTRALLKSLV